MNQLSFAALIWIHMNATGPGCRSMLHSPLSFWLHQKTQKTAWKWTENPVRQVQDILYRKKYRLSSCTCSWIKHFEKKFEKIFLKKNKALCIISVWLETVRLFGWHFHHLCYHDKTSIKNIAKVFVQIITTLINVLMHSAADMIIK